MPTNFIGLDNFRPLDDEFFVNSFTRRAEIHPDQLRVIEQAYLPTEEAAARARQLLARGEGAGALADGSFVDAAILRQARQVVGLAERYGTRTDA